MSNLEVGQPVPNFKLPASNGSEWSLSDSKGKKVVLFFYPKDMTPGCTQESCDFRDQYSAFKQLNTEVVGISPDDLKSHGKFIEKHSLPYVLLSDTDHQVCERFGVWKLKMNFGREYMGVERSTFLIDEEGKLIYEWRKVKVAGHIEEVVDTIKKL